MKQRLIEIIEELRDVKTQQEMDISDTTLFSEACSFLRGEFASQNKRAWVDNSKSYKQKEVIETKVNVPSEKQLDYIRKNEPDLRKKGFDIDNIQTKTEAHKIISEHIKLKGGKK